MNKLKSMITSSGFFALKQATVSLSHFNKGLQEELNAWEDGYTIQLKVLPNGPAIAFEKVDGKLQTISPNKNHYSLVVVFKTEEIAYRIITTQNSVPQAFTQNRLMVYGSTADSMILIRILNIVQAYLFPPILSKRILKRVPKFNLSQHIGRVRVYSLGLITGY